MKDKEKLRWLENHPAFISPEKDENGYYANHLFRDELYIWWSWFNPLTNELDDNEYLNTEYAVCIEHGVVFDIQEYSSDFENRYNEHDIYTHYQGVKLSMQVENKCN